MQASVVDCCAGLACELEGPVVDVSQRVKRLQGRQEMPPCCLQLDLAPGIPPGVSTYINRECDMLLFVLKNNPSSF